MSYVKYNEDDIKILEHRRFMKYGLEGRGEKRASVRYYDCKYCHEIFTERESLFFHIKSKHNIVRPLIVVNNKIATDYYIVRYIESAYIDLFGYNGSISINNDKLTYSLDEEMIDITLPLRKALTQESCCCIYFDEISVDIELAAISVKDLSVIDCAIEQWENEIKTGKRLSTECIDVADDGNRLFLQGIYNYYLACRAKNEKAKRYDDAWAILSQFNEVFGLGRCVLKTIAYRRNWLSNLQLLTDDEGDDFSIANDYYQRKRSHFKKSVSEKQLYIEDDTKMSLELVRLFQQRRYDEVRTKIAQLPDFDFIDDINLVDQLNLLCARVAVIEGNNTKAQVYYNRLITPAFQEEYELYKKGMVHFG